MRTCHYLKRNESCESPSNILIVDTEAKIVNKPDGIQEQSFRLGHAIHLTFSKGEWFSAGYDLHSIQDFWNLLDKFSYSKTRLWIIAHNMAYDYTILKIDSYLSSRKLEITMRVIDSVFIVKAKNLMFISSTNFYQYSLEKLGNIFGLSKMECPDFESCSDSELMPYCIRDCQVLANIIIKHINFVLDNNLGTFKPTIAGQALTAYRHRFMEHKLLIHTYNEILQLEQRSYRGGRCEAFRLGKFSDITCLDINSMYPFVMRENAYPTIPNQEIPLQNPSMQTVNAFLESGHFILAECDLNLKLPAIATKRDKLIFPIGKVRQVITSPEYEYILSHPDVGKIVKIRQLVTYNKAKIFVPYVDFFYSIKQTANNEAMRTQAKLFLNALYGKLGQHCSTLPKMITNEIERSIFLDIMQQFNTLEILGENSTKIVKLGDVLYSIEKHDSDFASNSIPIIASAVTSYARTYLFDLMKIAGFRNVYYCDTDSIFVNAQGLENLKSLVSQDRLGYLKIEKSGNVQIFGAKDYSFNGKQKLKGIKSDAKRLTETTFEQRQFVTKNMRYRDGIPDGIVITRPIVKRLTRNYDKGIVRGNRIVPFSMTDF